MTLFRTIWVLAGVSTCVGPALAAAGGKISTSPTWSKSSRIPLANESYLVGTRVNASPTLNDEIFVDPAMNRAMRSEYEARADYEESRDRAGLTERVEEKSRFEVMRDFARRAVDSVSRLRLKSEGDRIAKSAMNSNLPREPIAAVVLAASLYTGRSMNIKVFEGRPISSRVVLKDRNGSLSIPIASGFTSSIAYSADTKVTAQLSKQVATNVSAVVDSSQRGNAQVVYSVSF